MGNKKKKKCVFIPKRYVNKPSGSWKFSEGAEWLWLNFHGGDSAKQL